MAIRSSDPGASGTWSISSVVRTAVSAVGRNQWTPPASNTATTAHSASRRVRRLHERLKRTTGRAYVSGPTRAWRDARVTLGTPWRGVFPRGGVVSTVLLGNPAPSAGDTPAEETSG